MELVLGAQSPHGAAGNRRRVGWAAGLLLILAIAAIGGGYLASRHRPPPAIAPPASADISWSLVGPWPAPRSASAGPSRLAGDVASGYAHNELGAVLAAINTTERISPDAGPEVYTATIRDQTYGDRSLMLDMVSHAAGGGASPATALYYRTAYGDPTGDDPVLIAIAEQSADSTLAGGYFIAYRTLVWRDGDWRVQVPLTASEVATSIPGYQMLGRPHV